MKYSIRTSSQNKYRFNFYIRSKLGFGGVGSLIQCAQGMALLGYRGSSATPATSSLDVEEGTECQGCLICIYYLTSLLSAAASAVTRLCGQK